MQRFRDLIKKKQVRSKGCKACCCSCRLSVSSPEEPEILTISSIAHAMVLERLDEMMRERREARNEERDRKQTRREGTRFFVMVAMEKSSYDPREDFRESMEQTIVSTRIHEAKDLRILLNYYLTMNPEDSSGIILESFHDVCTHLFM